jgi:glucose-1-phosphate thymidylyltransferase
VIKIKGVILAGGTGSRLKPMTLVTNKHLLPVYNKPMIYYPLYTFINAGIKDIMVIAGKEHAGAVMELLGSGKEYGVKFTYRLQDEASGIAQALGLCEQFVAGDKVAVILGDNIFEDDIKTFVEKFEKGNDECMLFLKEVPDAQRFGVAEIDKGKNIIGIVEKPKIPKSNLAVTGLYMYDRNVFNCVKTLKPSARNEIEITDVNNWYVKRKKTKAIILKGFWSDAGTVESLFRATEFLRKKELGR